MSVISDIKMILESNNIHLLHDAKSYLEQIERWDAIKDADLAEVVRCKDCKDAKFTHNAPPECKWYCKKSVNLHSGNFFCSLGERKNDD